MARVIIDATERANVARMAGATFNEYTIRDPEVRRVVVGGRRAREGFAGGAAADTAGGSPTGRAEVCPGA